MPEKYPLPEVVVIRPEAASLDQIKILEDYIKEQLNVRKVTFTTDKSSYGVELQAEPQIPVLGKRLGKEAKNVFKLWVSLFLLIIDYGCKQSKNEPSECK